MPCSSIPDRQVQARLSYIFDLFAELRVARRVVARLRREGLQIPAQTWGGPGHGEVRWKVPTFGAIMRLLHNPAYAGAYVYGQKEYDSVRSLAGDRQGQDDGPAAGRLAGVRARMPTPPTSPGSSSCGINRRSGTTGSGPAPAGPRAAGRRCSRGSPGAAGAGPG